VNGADGPGSGEDGHPLRTLAANRRPGLDQAQDRPLSREEMKEMLQVAEIYRSYTRLLSKKLDELKRGPPRIQLRAEAVRHSLSISAGRAAFSLTNDCSPTTYDPFLPPPANPPTEGVVTAARAPRSSFSWPAPTRARRERPGVAIQDLEIARHSSPVALVRQRQGIPRRAGQKAPAARGIRGSCDTQPARRRPRGNACWMVCW